MLSLLEAIRKGWIRSAHDVAEGGLAITLAESAISMRERPLGLDVTLEDDTIGTEALLYGEGQTRVVISCSDADVETVIGHFSAAGVPARRIGTVGHESGRFRIATPRTAIDVPVLEVARTYYDAIPRRMDQTPVDVATALESEVHRS